MQVLHCQSLQARLGALTCMAIICIWVAKLTFRPTLTFCFLKSCGPGFLFLPLFFAFLIPCRSGIAIQPLPNESRWCPLPSLELQPDPSQVCSCLAGITREKPPPSPHERTTVRQTNFSGGLVGAFQARCLWLWFTRSSKKAPSWRRASGWKGEWGC